MSATRDKSYSEPDETGGVKRQRRKHARPSEITRAALDELAEKGVAGSTLNGIAKRAGIARTTVYLYFETKEEIFKAVAQDVVESAINEAAGIVMQQHGTFDEVFSQVVETIYSRLVKRDVSVILRVLVADGRDHPELVTFYYNEILAKGQRTLEQLIARGIACGELPPSSREIDIRLLIAPAIFAAIWGLVFSEIEPLDLEKFQHYHVRVMLAGIKTAQA